jgi:predicted amidohydrolase YtcJ
MCVAFGQGLEPCRELATPLTRGVWHGSQFLKVIEFGPRSPYNDFNGGSLMSGRIRDKEGRMRTKRAEAVSRRDFLKVGSVALAATLASCERKSRTSQLLEQPTLGAAIPEFATPARRALLEGPADTILRNGKIYTVDPTFSIGEALALKGGLVQAVGDEETAGAMIGDSTEVIDLGGRSVTPGLIDGHIHFRGMGLMYSYYVGYMPPDVKDIPGLQRALAETVRSKQPGEWIMGYYMALVDKPVPTKEDFDPVSPDNPVFIMQIGGHWATANSAALQIAKIRAGTKSPDGGIVEMGLDGEPTGVLYNHRAMDVVRQFAPPITTDLVEKSIVDSQSLLAACGVTSFQDNNIRMVEDIKAYQDLTRAGKLVLRNDLYLTLEWPADMAKVDQVDHYQDDITRFAGFKFLIDGQGPTAYCHEKHNGTEWRMPTWDPEEYKSTVRTLHDTGLQVCTHCIGDAAADLALEAYEGAMNANPRSDPRHRIEHAILTTAGATRKMRDLGVVVSTEPAFLYLFGDGWYTIFGEQRMERMMVTREWLEAGVHLAINSDAPSSPFYHPGWSMAGAMNRQTLKKALVGPDQGLTFEEALRAHTIENAYAAHEENIKGSLEPGKFADLAVWMEDPSSLNLEQLALTKQVYMTMVGGKIIHREG